MEPLDDGDAEYVPEPGDAGDLWCPLCGAVVYADAVECPVCHQFITPGLPPRRASGRMRIVTWVLVALAAAAVLSMVLRFA